MKPAILQFCPTKYPQLLENKKIEYKGHTLKTAYLMDIIHNFIVKKYLQNISDVHLWSVILRHNYGTFYKRYIDWCIDHQIIRLKKKWRSGENGHSKMYSLILDLDRNTITRKLNDDKILLKKKNFRQKIENKKLTPIYQEMINDLKHIKLDYDKALAALDSELEYSLTNDQSYLKNRISIDSIKNEAFYTTKDEYGRLHTNYTNLKKSIRNNFLTIDGKEIVGLDVKNCQPKLLAKLIIEKEKNLSNELQQFIQAVKDNTFYDSFKHLDLDKKAVKKIVFQVFFGKNRADKNNNDFKKVWPAVWEWIVKFKKEKRNHRQLSHLLQKMESDLIYNKICQEIKNVSKNIVLFTVHDGLFFAKENEEIVKPIFDKFESQII